jgi:protein-S-isoprenylcysteine O-methyltransferase Ste14
MGSTFPLRGREDHLCCVGHCRRQLLQRLCGLLMIIGMMAVVIIPKEEAQLLSKFGDEYRAFMKRTGRLLS